MTEGTTFILRKQCTQCAGMTTLRNMRCPHCNHIFTKEASEEEKQAFFEKLSKMSESGKGGK